ncbi:MAG: RsmB/NOP family class I SAM-dependent RNA methyltransferase [Pseudomonadota bacterium]
MSGDATPARQLALSALKQVLNDKKFLTDVELSGPVEDQARAQSLARGVLRFITRLDSVLESFLKKRPPTAVMHILRIGSFEILVEKGADHAVVDQAVRLTKGNSKTAGFKGLVNAVCRKLATAEAQEVFSTTTAPMLPNAFLGQMKSIEEDAFQNISNAHQKGAPIDITLKDIELSSYYAEKFDAARLPTGSLRLKTPTQISKLDGFVDGKWWVQDAAAAMPARLLGIQKGMRVLDLCAAPGGKTLQLASMGADVVALDISNSRMQTLRENLKRCRLEAEIIVKDALLHDREQYDAILLDAPCSASGTIRRHPELPILKANMDLGALLTLQKDLLARATALLKPGAEIVYATCSLFDAEGIAQAEWAEKKLSLTPAKFDAENFGLSNAFQPAPHCLRLRPDYWPDLGGMDGFFMAKFTKTG